MNAINVIECCGFKVGDKVNTPYGEGEVWKVTDISVHVKHWEGHKHCPHDWVFSKYVIKPWHHAQNPITAISHIPDNNKD